MAPNSVQFATLYIGAGSTITNNTFIEASSVTTPEGPVYFFYTNTITAGIMNFNALFSSDNGALGAIVSFK